MTKRNVDSLANKLTKLVEIFRQGGPAENFHWWNKNSPLSIFYPSHGYQEGQPLFETVVQGILKLNSNMLSEHWVERKLVYEFLQKQTISENRAEHLNNQNLLNESKNLLNELIAFEQWQNVDIPIANLWLEGAPAKLGEVNFVSLTEEDIKEWRDTKALWPYEAPDFRVVAQVNSPGDRHKALSYALNNVTLVLDVFRAFCFPFGHHSDTWKIGVVGDIISSASTPMRINNRFVTRLGPSTTQIELWKNILSKLEQTQWELISRLILKTDHTTIGNKMLDSIHWLAESTKPDTNNSKFLKIGIALETLMGGEAKDKDLKIRGITAMLAERAALVAGRGLDDRLAIDHEIRTHYDKRSSIVHGDKLEVSLDDIDDFGRLVRRLVLAQLKNLEELGNEISTVDELERWCRKQKYSLPYDPQEEGT